MLPRLLFSFYCLLFLSPWCLADEPAHPLGKTLTALAKEHKGKVAIAFKHLQTGETFYYNGDEVLPTASLIKFPIMIEVYMQVLEGKIKLTDMVTLHEADKVPGSGILTYHFSEGAAFPLKDAVRLMIAYSDNTATNLVLDKIGIASTNKRMQAWGFPNMRINAKVFRGSTSSVDPERTKKYGLGSTTAREMIELLDKVHHHKVATPQYCKEMITHLKKCEGKNMLPRLLPAGVEIAHKTGSVNDARTDAGILYFKKGPVALCVLTADNKDRSWTKNNAAETLGAKVAKEVYNYYQGK